MAIARARPLKYVKRFTSGDWINNSIEIIRTGIPVSGQLGPHYLPPTYLFETEVYKQKNAGAHLEEVWVASQQLLDGRVVLRKAPLAPCFDGVILIRANRYD